MSEGWLDRLVVERDETQERLKLLHLWLMDEDNHSMVSTKELALMMTQTFLMAGYLEILDTRLTYYEKKERK